MLALARGLKKRLEPAIKNALSKNRLLIVTPFDEKVKRVTRETASQRNRFMAELADEIFVAYALPGGNIEKLIQIFHPQEKQFHPLKQIKRLRFWSIYDEFIS